MENAFTAAILAIGMALIATVIVLMVQDAANADRINSNFTQHCNTMGGHAIISDKDLCVRNGLIVDHKG